MPAALDREDARLVVAPDRLQLSGLVAGEHLLHQRLTVFYGYFFVVAVLAAGAARFRRISAGLDPGSIDFLQDVQIAYALALGLVFVALKVRAWEGPLLHALDATATLATAATAAVALSAVPYLVTVDVSAVAFFVLFFAVRAALVPSAPWITTVVAGVSAIPFMFGLAAFYRGAGPTLVPDPLAATTATGRTLLAGVAAVYLVSRTIYGLRTVAEKAVRLGQYVVHEKIGEGAMGAVYRASHALLKRPTAIKVIPPDRAGPQAIARFEREVLATSRLTHPNNVAIYDFGVTPSGVFYYAMELLDGETLARLIERRGPQPVSRVRAILRQLTAALAEAHDAGLVHRDVKPENVMLCTRGGLPDFVKVVDFGLVKEIVPTSDLRLTADRALAGTPLYMAPESILTPESVGAPADVYAVGCVAHFLLTGRTPFAGKNLLEVCTAHVHEAPAPPSSHAPHIPPSLDALILSCLAKDPDDRPTTRELEAALAA